MRHSLATFLAENVSLQAAQKMLRHKLPSTTAGYVHAVLDSQIAAQGQYLSALKMASDAVQ